MRFKYLLILPLLLASLQAASVSDLTFTLIGDIDGDGNMDVNEDLDGDGNLDVAEDVDGDGKLDVAECYDNGEDLYGDGNLDVVNEDASEDLDGDGNLDVNEDVDGDGNLDVAEDVNSNGILDVGEDLDGDGNLDVNEDLDGDGKLDLFNEDFNGNGILDIYDYEWENCDLDGDGNLDINEDVDGDGNLDVAEDVDGDGNLDVAEYFSYSVTDCLDTASGSLEIPSTYNGLPVTSIGIEAFRDCINLTNITLPDSVILIGEGAFRSCSTLDIVSLGSNVTSIGSNAFYFCTDLSSINIPDGVTSIGGSAFYGCTDLTSIIIPDSATSIGASAFSGCTNLSLVTLGDGINTIASRTFFECGRIFNITIPETVTEIGAYAFASCSNINEVTIPDSVTKIHGYAFSGCNKLNYIHIGSGVTSIGDYAFSDTDSYNYNIQRITCSANIAPAVYTNVFLYARTPSYSIPFVYVTGNLNSYGDTWAGLRVIARWEYTVLDGKATLTAAALSGNVIIPSYIDGYPVTKIGDDNSGSIFGGSSNTLYSIVLPPTLTSISSDAFSGCTNLNSITSEASTAPSLGNNAFLDVAATQILVPAGSGQSYLDEGGGSTYGGLEVTYVENQNTYNTVFNQIRSTGQQDVVNDPAAYNLATADEVSTATSNARSTGQQDVVNDPTSFGLYDESSILDLNVTTPTISMLGESNDALVEFTIETSEDLQNWSTSEVIQRNIDGLGEKFFLRVRAGEPYVEPYIEPDVLVYEHPSLGNILTTQSGQALYRFTIDNNGSYPLYNGTSWLLVSASDAPVADSGVSSVLGSATFSNVSGGPYLTVNGYPAYTFTGDIESGQATGHNSGTVWYTIKADGSLNN